jgi:DNA topoisomerase VI subunit B
MTAAPRLDRVAFTTSRLSEFVSRNELTAQTGQRPDAWLLLILKELADNALDACEEADVAPVIEVEVLTERGLIKIADNGPGIPVDTITRMLDYSTRTSSREAYIAPTRGAQGNALKTILAMGFALDGKSGSTEIECHGRKHSIRFEIDAVRRTPKLITDIGPSFVQTGTSVTVHWPMSACWMLCDARGRFAQMACNLAWLNPHLSLACTWDGERTATASADPAWGETKWRPSDPTSPHWYSPDTFTRYMTAHIARDEDEGRSNRTVREFIGELRGLARSGKQKFVLDEVGAARSSLAGFFAAGKNADGVARLLEACRAHSKPIKPEALGVIGEDNVRTRMLAAGAVAQTFRYRRKAAVDEHGMPWLVEAAFAWRDDDDAERTIISGINWSAAIGDPFSSLGRYGKSLGSILVDQWAGNDEPIVVFVHAITPRAQFVDRGKSAVAIPISIAEEIEAAAIAVTKDWARQKAREFRDHKASLNRRDRLARPASRNTTIKDAAALVMEKAYLKASGGGRYPVLARQIMYASRPDILELTGKASFTAHYFTQTILPDYLNDHPEHAQHWDIVWDARGTFREPHTGREVPLGTREVRGYLASRPVHENSVAPFEFARHGYPTVGPEARYGTVLFIEKEGFDPLLKASNLGARLDAGLMSTKGMSVIAARHLVDKLSVRGVQKILVLHDFDVSGFTIFGTLGASGRRYKFANDKIPIVDLGLRLADVEAMGLESEPVVVKGEWGKRESTLRRHGATPEEVMFLRNQRVELNAMTSPGMIEFIDAKFKERGVEKVIPDDATIERHAREQLKLDLADKLLADNWAANVITPALSAALPSDLREKIAQAFRKHPALSWDSAVSLILRREGAP